MFLTIKETDDDILLDFVKNSIHQLYANFHAKPVIRHSVNLLRAAETVKNLILVNKVT